MIKRLRYISTFATAMSPAAIDALAKTSAAKNEELGITGVLVATGELFFQVIEGPPAAVDELWSSIQRDARHTDVMLLESEQGGLARMYPEWSMAVVDLSSESVIRLAPLRAVLRAVHTQVRVSRSLTAALEEAMWVELNSGGRAGERRSC